ncbi:MAG: hypothetical protein LLG00_16645 [Planctomycetaceae bacterium]|nr:hypothetical protein [Planctomycetaceae bacterium]
MRALDDAKTLIRYVPKDPAANLRWRARIRREAVDSVAVREMLYDAASADILFFFNAFLWVLEPRAFVKVKPFVTWPHQDPVILGMSQAIRDAQTTEEPLALTLQKSRAQGGTYAYLGVDLWWAIFYPGFSVGLVTRSEALVDSKTDDKTILYKVAWMLDRLPFWLRGGDYQRSLTEHTLLLPNSSLFTGYSATGDVARGGRTTKFDFDEVGSEEFISGGKDYRAMSSVSSVSNCTFLVSTFGADAGVFYEAATDPENPRLYTLDWKDNPTQNKNAYIMREGVLVAVRPEEQAAVTEYGKRHAARLKRIERRGHTMEGKVRAPWYDAYCLLPGATPRFVARELDMNPRGAVGKVFDPEILDRMKADCCKPPVFQGNVVFDPQTLEFRGLIRQENGPLKLWFKPGLDHSPPIGLYALGCDIAMGGTGEYSSNSAICGVERATGQQVLEYAIMAMASIHFAKVAVVLARWLRNAYLGWEDSGMASAFATEIIDTAGYGNIYYREVAEHGTHAKTRNPGWWNKGDESKADLFENMCIEMGDGKFVPRSEDLIRECGEYEWENGKIVHRGTKLVGVSGKAHGDRCIAAGVAGLLCRDRPQNHLDDKRLPGQDAPYGTLAWRIQEEKAKRSRLGDDQTEYTLADLVRSE